MGVRQLFELEGRTALITGGSRGLGLQIAQALGEMGAKLAIAARKQHELDQAAAQLRGQGFEVLSVSTDLQNPDAATPLVQRVLDTWGRLDVLVNNAGATWGAAAEEQPLDAWNKVLSLNLTAVFVLTQAAGRLAMIPARYGRIINIASVAGLQGTDPRFMATLSYNTSKAGLINFTRQIAAEWGKFGITCNAIAPGVFPTKMARGMIDQAAEFILDRTPLKRLGSDQDLKGVAVLLASDAGSYITGQTIAVDGGMTAI